MCHYRPSGYWFFGWDHINIQCWIFQDTRQRKPIFLRSKIELLIGFPQPATNQRAQIQGDAETLGVRNDRTHQDTYFFLKGFSVGWFLQRYF